MNDYSKLDQIADELDSEKVTQKVAAMRIRDWIKESLIENFLRNISDEQSFLHKVCKELTKQENPKNPFPIWEEFKKCPKCQISLDGVMMYSCPNLDCPCGLGPTTC